VAVTKVDKTTSQPDDSPTSGTKEDTTSTAKTTPPKPQSTGKKSRWPWIMLLMIVMLCAGAALALYNLNTLAARYPLLASWLPTAHLTETINNRFDDVETTLTQHDRQLPVLEDRLSQLEQQVAALNAQTAMSPDIAAQLAELRERITTLSPVEDDNSQSARIDMLISRMTQLEGAFIPLSRNLIEAEEARLDREALRQNNAALREQVDALAARLTRLEAFAAQDNHAAILAWQASTLRRALLSGSPFVSEFKQLQIAATELGQNRFLEDLLQQLTPLAETGIVPRETLQQRLHKALPDIHQAAAQRADANWWQSTLDKLSSLIVVRNRDNQTGNDIDSVLNRMHQAISRDDFESLLAEQDHLGSAPRASLEPWWQDVNDHATAVKILTQLEHRLQGQLMPATPVARQVETTPQTNPMTEEAP